MASLHGISFDPDRRTVESRRSTFREYGKRFIRYHKDLVPQKISDELFREQNRRAARSFLEDLSAFILEPLISYIGFYFIYFAAIWDDVMFTWDWGLYNEHQEDYSKASAHQAVRYSKGWDRPTRKQFSLGQQPDVFIDHYV